MKLTAEQRELMRELGRRGGVAVQKSRTPEDKRLHALKMVEARHNKAAKLLDIAAAPSYDGPVEP
jgi:hypothetical protein